MRTGLSQLHENKKLVLAAQTRCGQFVVWVIASLMLYWHDVTGLMIVSLALVTLLPERRRPILSLLAVGMIVAMFLDRPDTQSVYGFLSPGAANGKEWLTVAIKVSGILAILYLAYYVATNFSRLPKFVRRIPIFLLHFGIWLALIGSSILGVGIFGMGPFLAWRLSYLMAQAGRGTVSGTSFSDHLFYLMPVFGGTSTPYGKGLDYLGRHEAVDAESFSRSQLAGLKLLVLAVFWVLALDLMDAAMFGNAAEVLPIRPGAQSFNVPRLGELLSADVDVIVPVAWASIYLELIRATLTLAITGHIIIGCLRLLGFNVFRNTYKPLLAESIVEFWSRYYFYFKELLVDLFFYPAFLSCSWAGKKLRLFIAVFSAAFIGNMYYHLLLRYELVTNMEIAALWSELGPRLVYCALLATGIWVSMLRQQKRRSERRGDSVFARVLRIAGVWTFFGIINIWNTGLPGAGFAERMDFIAFLCFM